MNTKNRGFISLSLLLVIAIGAIAIGGVSYITIKNNEAVEEIALERENENLIPAQTSASILGNMEFTESAPEEIQKSPQQEPDKKEKTITPIMKKSAPKDKPVASPSIVNTPRPTQTATESSAPKIETWAELEAQYFLSADQKGWSSLVITNKLGEKRYYRKEGIQWVRKNTEAEAAQSYIKNSSDSSVSVNNNVNQYSDMTTTILQNLQTYIDQQNSIISQMQIELKPLKDELQRLENESDEKCPDIFIVGERRTQCQELNREMTRVINQQSTIIDEYRIKLDLPLRPLSNVKNYSISPLPAKQYWQVNSGPYGQGTITNINSGSQLDYNCDPMGQCMISGY